MNARYEDAATGWEIYRRLSGSATRLEINETLRSRGLRPISPRTIDHNGKLARLGYDDYVSINRLDLRHATESVFDIADRSRYADHLIRTPARLHVPSADEVATFRGEVTRISEGFASFVTASSWIAKRAARATKYNKGVLEFERVPVERAVRISEAVETDGQLEMLLVFRSLLEADLFFPAEMPHTSVVHLLVPLGANPSLYSVVTVFRRTFDMYESLRGFVDVVITAARPAARPALANPRVRRLTVGSPFDLQLVGSPLVWPLIAWAVAQVIKPIRELIGGYGDVQQLRHARNEEGRRQDRHRLEIEAFQLDNYKRRIEIAGLLDALGPTLRRELGLALPEAVGPFKEQLEAFKNQMVEAAAEIAQEAIDDVTLQDPGPAEGLSNSDGQDG
jgi:hypothetical protein